MLHTGMPRVVRVDRGTENSTIAYLQPFLRRNGQDSFAGEKSFLYGQSITNQVYRCISSLISVWNLLLVFLIYDSED